MITISEIEDFTDKLKENPLSFNFNPSIAHWKENLYLICYRTYLKNFINPERGIADRNIHLPNHPWAESPWDSSNGYDKTGFCIIQIINGEIILYKELNKGNSIYYNIDENIYKSEDKNIKGVDARLIKLGKNSFLVSYNKIVLDSSTQIKNGNCSSGCVLIATRIINLSENGDIYFEKEMILCDQISNSTEKNWSFFKYNEQLFFSYGLTPNHIIYSLYLKNNTAVCGNLNSQDTYTYYGNYEKNVNDLDLDSKKKKNKKNILYISVSTPAIPNKDNKDRYIAVGHVKFSSIEKHAKKIKSKTFQNFYEIILDKRSKKKKEKFFIESPVYDYLMFLYEFDPINGHITSVSDMFIPEDSKYLLAFPTGLIYIENDLWIFYGDHDSNCKVIKIKDKYVSQLLKKTSEDPKSFSSEDINYFIFPKKCVTKSIICDLLLNL